MEKAMGPSAMRLFFVLAVGVTLSFGCSSNSEYVPIPVEDARALRTHVSAFYASTTELLEGSSQSVERVGAIPDGIRPEDFEIQLVKNALMSCLNDNIELVVVTNEPPRGVLAERGSDPYQPLTERDDLGVVAFCNPSEMISLESYIEHAPRRVKEFVIDRVLLVDTLRVNLKHVLQERLNLLEEYGLDARGDVARLRDTSRQTYEAVVSGEGEVTAEQRVQTEADYEVIQGELDEIEGLVDTIANELTDLRRFRRQLVEDIAVRLAAMGTPDS